MKLNLYYYMYPYRGAPWPWHIQRLKKYWDVWNGRKLVFISMDEETATREEVDRELGTLRHECVWTRNDRARGESASFVRGLEMLASTDPEEATFYAHTKGVSYRDVGWKLENTLAWAEAMYTMNLGCPEAIAKLLVRYATVGCFLNEGPHAGSSWHYSGAFFWFNHAAIFSRPQWQSVFQSKYGVEGYLGRLIQRDRAFCLTDPITLNLYESKLPASLVDAWLERVRMLN